MDTNVAVPCSVSTPLSAGRIPQPSALDLGAADVAHATGGVTVAGHLQSTTNPAVYAADTPGMPLTPVAVFEGKVAASNMLKLATTVPDCAGIPTALFTIPELARVGPLEHEATAAGIDVDVRYNDTSGWSLAIKLGLTTRQLKSMTATYPTVGSDLGSML
jgi:glutathione reductase (NADPH)